MSTPMKSLEYYLELLEASEEISEITKFIAQMPSSELALFGFLFLPIVLLGWLLLFKLFDISMSARKWLFMFISIAYIAVLVFVKIESIQKVKAQILKQRVVHEFVDRSINKCPATLLCQSLEIQLDDLKELVNNDPDAFHSSKNAEGKIQIKIKEAHVESTISQKQKDVLETIKVSGQLSLDSLQTIAAQTDFGKITDEFLEEIASKNPELIILEKDGKKIVKAANLAIQ